MSDMKSNNSAKNVYDDDNIPEIDLPKKNVKSSDSMTQKKDDKEEGK